MIITHAPHKGHWCNCKLRTHDGYAYAFRTRIAELEGTAATLLREHSTVKAAGLATAAKEIERLARELIGPFWSGSADRWEARDE